MINQNKPETDLTLNYYFYQKRKYERKDLYRKRYMREKNTQGRKVNYE